MAAQKSIAKQADAPSRAATANASTSPRVRAGMPRSSRNRNTPSSARAPRKGGGSSPPAYDELLENLSRHLSLVETVSIALRTLEDRPEVGPICAALEQAVTLLGRAHEAVDEYLRRRRT